MGYDLEIFEGLVEGFEAWGGDVVTAEKDYSGGGGDEGFWGG